MPEVSVVIVCMNRPDILYPCLDSLRSCNSVSMEVFVVAYMFSSENLAALRADYPWVTVLESTELRGFSENNNLALTQARGKYCFVVNDDTLMSMPVVDQLVADMARLGPHVAAISPRIVFPDGRVQTCGRAPWTAWRWMKHYLHLVDETKPSKWSRSAVSGPDPVVISSGAEGAVEKSNLFRTWTLNGACFLARTSAFREAGWFDPYYFFTPEDIALGQKFGEMGYEVWVDADVSITHLAGGTVYGKSGTSSRAAVSLGEPAIKPARVQGALHYYSGGSCFKRFFLALFVWLVESARGLKYLFASKSDPSSRAAVMSATARNVRRSVFTRLTPKEVFSRFFK